jgi:hypothetical protein
MKTTDFDKFKKMVKSQGYSIGHSTKHHTILRPDGSVLTGFPVNHAKGQKEFVLDVYVKRIMAQIAADREGS